MTCNARAAAAAAAVILASAVIVEGRQAWLRPAPASEWSCVDEMHEFYVRTFESVGGNGLSRMPQPPMMDRSGVLDFGTERYAIERLELVGLLKHETPVAYVAPRHGLRLDPADFQGRALSGFEAEALARLRAGRGVEMRVGTEPGTLLVLGALRGDGSCLKCHTARREGDLLGAFSYTLRVIRGLRDDRRPVASHGGRRQF